MLQYKKECEARYQNDLQTQIRRMKDFELSRIRMEEADRYREKMEAFRTEMETMHVEKVKELKDEIEKQFSHLREIRKSQ